MVKGKEEEKRQYSAVFSTEIMSNFGTSTFLLAYSLKVEKLRAFLFLKMYNNVELHCCYLSDTSGNFITYI